MRWGRKKHPPNPPPASPRPSLLSSWLLRFKKMGIISSGHGGRGSRDRVECKPPGKVNPSSCNSSSRGPGVYRREDAFWNLSFRKEKVDGGVKELLGNPDEELGDAKNFDQMVSGIRQLREVERKSGLKTPMRGKFTRIRGKVGVENSGPSSIGSQDCSLSATESEFEEIEERIAEMGSEDLKSERRRKSLYVRARGSPRRRPRSSCRVRIHSPRVAAIVSSDEQAKRAKLKTKSKKKSKENGLERFAVMKCSFNPQRDFRDSMIEMILDRRIRKPDDLEELLACYLTLNSDDYHDVIIKVFRQLWFELNQASCCEYDPAELTTEEERY